MPTKAKKRAGPELAWNFNQAMTVLVIVFLIALILRLARAILFPFFVALFLAFLLAPVLDFLTKLKVPRAVSVILILVIAFLVVYLLGTLFYSSGKAFADELPRYGQKINNLAEYLRDKMHITSREWDPLGWLTKLDVSKVASFLVASLGPFFSFLTNLFLVFLFLIFIMVGHGRVLKKIPAAYSPERSKQILTIIEHIRKQVQRYLAIKTAVNLVIGILTTVFLLVLGLDFAIVFGFLAFLLNYIPNLGAVFAAIFPALMAFFQFESPLLSLLVLGVVFLMEQAMGLVEVRAMGQGLGLSPLLVFFSLIFWGWLWGIPGMLLAVPILAVIKIICFNIPALKSLAIMISS
jgi:AI-2 transport protein TqsA